MSPRCTVRSTFSLRKNARTAAQFALNARALGARWLSATMAILIDAEAPLPSSIATGNVRLWMALVLARTRQMQPATVEDEQSLGQGKHAASRLDGRLGRAQAHEHHQVLQSREQGNLREEARKGLAAQRLRRFTDQDIARAAHEDPSQPHAGRRFRIDRRRDLILARFEVDQTESAQARLTMRLARKLLD